jgi:hypothetical protein
VLSWISAAYACQCAGLAPLDTVARDAPGVFAGEVVTTDGGRAELVVRWSARGPAVGARVRLWGDTGKSCRASVAPLAVGSTWLVAAEPVPLDESLPSPARPDDWGLLRCAVSAAPVAHGRVDPAGGAAPGAWRRRWRSGRRRAEAAVVRAPAALAPGPAVVEGVRVDAKAGPVLLVGDVPVYVVDHPPWTDAERGTPGRLAGALAREVFLPPPVSPTGEPQQGGDGGAQWVLRPAP